MHPNTLKTINKIADVDREYGANRKFFLIKLFLIIIPLLALAALDFTMFGFAFFSSWTTDVYLYFFSKIAISALSARFSRQVDSLPLKLFNGYLVIPPRIVHFGGLCLIPGGLAIEAASRFDKFENKFDAFLSNIKLYFKYLIHFYPTVTFAELRKILNYHNGIIWESENDSVRSRAFINILENNNRFDIIKTLVKIGAESTDFPRYTLLQQNAELAICLEQFSAQLGFSDYQKELMPYITQQLYTSKNAKKSFITGAQKAFIHYWNTCRKVRNERSSLGEQPYRETGLNPMRVN